MLIVAFLLYALTIPLRLSGDYFNAANQSLEEKDYPKLHKCVDLGEAYSAAYLTSKLHLSLTNIKRNLSWVPFLKKTIFIEPIYYVI